VCSREGAICPLREQTAPPINHRRVFGGDRALLLVIGGRLNGSARRGVWCPGLLAWPWLCWLLAALGSVSPGPVPCIGDGVLSEAPRAEASASELSVCLLILML